MTAKLDLQQLQPDHLELLDAAEAKSLVVKWLEGGLRAAHRFRDADRCSFLLETVRHPPSRREQAVFERAALGGSGKLIALELGVSVSTVSHHITNGLRRRGLSSRGELLAIAALPNYIADAEPQSAQLASYASHGIAKIDMDGESKLVAWFPLTAPEHVPLLTPAECAVIAAALAGNSNAEIARERGASPHTVANQLRSAYRKLNVGSRWELGAVAAAAVRL